MRRLSIGRGDYPANQYTNRIDGPQAGSRSSANETAPLQIHHVDDGILTPVYSLCASVSGWPFPMT